MKRVTTPALFVGHCLPSMISLRGGKEGLHAAVRARDIPIFEWLVQLVPLQGISDRCLQLH